MNIDKLVLQHQEAVFIAMNDVFPKAVRAALEEGVLMYAVRLKDDEDLSFCIDYTREMPMKTEELRIVARESIEEGSYFGLFDLCRDEEAYIN